MAHSANLALAHHLADLAAEIAQRHRAGGPLAARVKDDGSPVTDADHEVEHTLRSRIRQEHPDDEFLGEESGGSETAHRRWIIDGIDVTANYLAGEPEWSTLIALEERDEITLGMVSAPALDRRWWALPDHGSWTAPQSTRSGSPARRLSIAEGSSLRDAVIGIWPPAPRLSPAQRALAATLAARAAHTRPALDWSGVDPAARAAPPAKPSAGTGTCHGGLLVATGQLDAFLLMTAGPWDIAALIPVVQEAGGVWRPSPQPDEYPPAALTAAQRRRSRRRTARRSSGRRSRRPARCLARGCG